jgi:ribosomal-protein-alanine N-acetyltransferase
MSVVFRPWQPADAASVFRYANNRHIASNLRDAFPFPYTMTDAKAYVAGCIAAGEDAQLTRAICYEDEVVGSIGVFLGTDVHRKSAELGYWLAEPFWGQGIMSTAVGLICRLAFESFDIVRIYAQPFAHNAASRRVLEKCGFHLEGVLEKSVYKNEEIQDSCMYALIKPEEK